MKNNLEKLIEEAQHNENIYWEFESGNCNSKTLETYLKKAYDLGKEDSKPTLGVLPNEK